jgi:hypothetical protein
LSTPFDELGRAAREAVAAVVDAEILVGSAQAARYTDFLHRCLVDPRPVGCQPATPTPDPSPAALMPLWIVLEEPPARGDRYFLVYEPDLRQFGIGVWQGHTAWFLEGWGGLFEMLARMSVGTD